MQIRNWRLGSTQLGLLALAAVALAACRDSQDDTAQPGTSASNALPGEARTASGSATQPGSQVAEQRGAGSSATGDGETASTMGPQVGYVVLRVTDLERSMAFYRDVLHMQQTFSFDIGDEAKEVAFGYPNAAGVVTGAGIVLLDQPNNTDPFQHGTTYNRYVLVVPNVQDMFDQLGQAGLTGLQMPVRYEQFKAIVGFATDPDGYRIEIMERIP